jgi:DNA invertase Pin-like site-specific DNA recombinase
MVNKIVFDPEAKLDVLHADAVLVSKDLPKLLACLACGDTLILPSLKLLGDTVDGILDAANTLSVKGVKLVVGIRDIDLGCLRAVFGVDGNTIQTTPTGTTGRPIGHKNQDRAEQIYRMRAQEMSLAQIAEALGVSKSTVQHYLLKRKGV